VNKASRLQPRGRFLSAGGAGLMALAWILGLLADAANRGSLFIVGVVIFFVGLALRMLGPRES